MSWLALAARCLLSAIFLVAGATKLLDLKGSRKAITDFGLPAWSADSLGVGLPLAEVAVGLLLLPAQTVWIGAIGALLLALIFSAAIAVNIALGRRPDCHCFGQVHSRPVDWTTFARSGVLALLAGLLAEHASTHTEYSLSSIASLNAAIRICGARGPGTALLAGAAPISTERAITTANRGLGGRTAGRSKASAESTGLSWPPGRVPGDSIRFAHHCWGQSKPRQLPE